MARRRYDPKKVSKALGLKVRELRNKNGWTLEDCEEQGWPSWRHLQTIEAGKGINLTTLVAIANLFGVHPSVLFEDI